MSECAGPLEECGPRSLITGGSAPQAGEALGLPTVECCDLLWDLCRVDRATDVFGDKDAVCEDREPVSVGVE